MNPESQRSLQGALKAWFAVNARELPWRTPGRRDPYRAWVAEVLLQQTQVSRGVGYYRRFLGAFPTLQALADAPLAAVLKAWEGCGYYARARHLHRAAQLVAAQGFPGSYDGWRALPGVGAYTAAALASLTLGEARAVNDGNVRRVLARLHGEREPQAAWVQARADELLDHADPGGWNEALMDLGATVCTPAAPRCGECPWRAHCAAFASGRPTDWPAPRKRTPVRSLEGVALVIGDQEAAYLERREGSLLGGLWGLPFELVEDAGPAAALERLCGRLGAGQPRWLGTVEHAMTHRRVSWRVYAAVADLPRSPVAEVALSRLDRKAFSLFHQPQAALFES